MVVVVASALPDAVRGKMKLWFVEPKPNVFVSGITDSLADRVVDMLMEHCTLNSGLLVFKSMREAPHFRIYALGAPERAITTISGLQMILENPESTIKWFAKPVEPNSALKNPS